ncbi:hypothetical protein ACFL1T_05015 [Chlamydiota bacterium]
MDNDISPEEKLLNLIKTGKKEIKSTTSLPLSEIAINAENSNPIDLESISEKGETPFSFFRKLNTFLKLATCLFCLLFILQIVLYSLRMKQLDKVKINTKKVTTFEDKFVPPSIALPILEKTFSGRELFKIFFIKKQKPKSPIKKQSIEALLRGYQLIGIIMEDEPTAIILDRKTKQTTYVRKGDMLNELAIINVSSNVVTVMYEDQQIDLSL